MYTFKQAAELAGLHENTARTYRDKFLEFFSCTREGRRRRYPEEAVAILRLISEKVSQNLTQEQIKVELGYFCTTRRKGILVYWVGLIDTPKCQLEPY